MSDRICSSCGAVNTGQTVYCTQCGGILKNLPSGGANALPATTAVAKRRQVRIEADRPAPPSIFTRIKGLVLYLLWVAVGVIVVLSLMSPKDKPYPSQDIPNAREVVRKMVSSSRFAPVAISQQLVNSCLSQQGPVAWESPVRLIPMPVWESNRVELRAGTLTLFATMNFLGRTIHLSETFRLEGTQGAWSFTPESASIGLLELPQYLLPVVKNLLRPGFDSFSEDLALLASSRRLVIRPGSVEVSAR